jgi:glycosyltransferase involved in cell wall biosynthesis
VGHLGNNGWRAVPLGRAADAPIVTIFHGTDVTVDLVGDSYGWRYRHLFQAPGAWFLAVAEHLRERLIAAGAPAARTLTHHLGVDGSEFGPDDEARAHGPLRVALVGRLIEVKGQVHALRAFRSVRARHPDAELHLFGEGPDEEALRAEAASLGLADAVRLRGVVPVETLRRELAAAHLALQPSVTDAQGSVEGVPNGVLEAMASALPVVATRHGGIPEAVRDGETGLLVAERDEDALARALVGLADAPERRAAMGAAGRRRVEEEFDLRLQGARLAAVCARAAEGYRALGWRERRRAWQRACEGLVDTVGRRQRARYQLRILANYVRGEIP